MVAETKDNKGAVILGLAGLGVLGWMLLKKKAVPTNVVPSGVIDWTASSRSGYSSMGTIVEGSTSNIATLNIANASHYSSGALAPYTFYLTVEVLDAFGNTIVSLGLDSTYISLDAGASGSGNITFQVPWGLFGAATAVAKLWTQDGTTLLATSNIVSFNISEATQLGGVTMGAVSMYNSARTGWFILPPPTSSFNTAIPNQTFFSAYWTNSSGGSLSTKFMATIQAPSNTKLFLSEYTGQGYYQINTTPGNGSSTTQWVGPNINIVGTFYLVLSLIRLDGALLARAKRTIVVS